METSPALYCTDRVQLQCPGVQAYIGFHYHQTRVFSHYKEGHSQVLGGLVGPGSSVGFLVELAWNSLVVDGVGLVGIYSMCVGWKRSD
jgi:hypothetical protein